MDEIRRKRNMNLKLWLLKVPVKVSHFHLIFISLLIYSCAGKEDFEIKEFNPFSNFSDRHDTLELSMDLTDAIVEGISLPSIRQCDNGYFNFSFKLINRTDKPQRFYFKIYYQNETYKFNEVVKKDDLTLYNELSGNNFYGSWSESADSFHITAEIPNDNEWHLVTDSFRIVGNPRNEEKYFGSQTKPSIITDEKIKYYCNEIRNTPEWFESVKLNAVKNNTTVEKQMVKDALWVIVDEMQKGNYNNRWKRNPRVGNYSFVLAVTPMDELGLVPPTLKYISRSDNGMFKNPYFDLLYNRSFNPDKKIVIAKSEKVLSTKAEFNLGSGIFIDLLKLTAEEIDTSFYSKNCGTSSHIFESAQFEQLFHNVNQNYKFNNIPIAFDVTGDNYTQEEYKKNAEKFKQNELITDFVYITKSPGKTVYSDPKEKVLGIITPGNSTGKLKKENVGVNSRIGLTYGKFVAKIKFPEIMNRENVWNGLTCAYWLKFQDVRDWNHRSVCDSGGYIAKSDESPGSPRLKTTYYSEIDFEILKTSKYWPKTSYRDNKTVPVDTPESNHNLIITCTNWDMACRTPKDYSVGAKEFVLGDRNYITHRWDDWYKALTIKHEFPHDSIFNRAYYYEIDWQPEKIIWRIGSDLNNMVEVGYMDNTITSIPDNQMVIVFSQEFHDSQWWPLSPFVQDMIPFPKNDIRCEILEVIVK